MSLRHLLTPFAALLALSVSLQAAAQSFLVQCPDVSSTGTGTALHPYAKAAALATRNVPGYPAAVAGNIKCQQVVGTDGYATMADGNQIYMFGFGPGSGLDLLSLGLPGTQTAADFNGAAYVPAGAAGGVPQGSFNSPYFADGLTPDPSYNKNLPTNRNAGIYDPSQLMNWGVLSANQPAPLIAIDEDDELFLTLSNVGMIMRPDLFEQHTIHFHGYPNASSYFDGVPDDSVAIAIAGSMTYYYTAPDAGTYFWHCHITPPEHLQMGMVGQLYVRPRQNRTPASTTVANPSCATMTLSSGAVVQDILCSAPPVPGATATTAPVLYTQPAVPQKFAYNDGDGSTRYDVEYPIQMMGFDPNFHYVGMTFNPEDFAGMKDKYYLLSGRGYPDTVADVTPGAVDASGNPDAQTGTQSTAASDGLARPSQPLPSHIVINRSTGGQTRALLRLSNLSVTELSTLGTIGVPMTVVGWNARMLRDLAGNNLAYNTNSITIGGGESADVILDVSDSAYAACTAAAPCTFFLYSPQLDHLVNDAENFGGMMTEILVQ